MKQPLTCILCEGAVDTLRNFAQSVTSESKLIPAASALHVCAECGHLQTTVEIDLRQYYAETYDSRLTDEGPDEIVSMLDGRIVFRTDLDFEIMKRHLAEGLEGSPSIFEFGCGRGRILSRLYKDGHRRLAAYDVSELYRDVVSRFVPAESIFIGQPPGGTFDLVISFFVLEHDVDPVGSLVYMRDRLASNGKLFLMIPNYVTNAVDLACGDHVNHFSPEMLVAVLEACGLQVIELDTSVIGAMAIVASSSGAAVSRGNMHLASPRRLASARASCAEFLDYMARLETVTGQLGGDNVALYGAGFYGTLVQTHLEAAHIRVVDVFDANPRKQGTSRLGLTVRSPDEFPTGKWADSDLVMCINSQIAAGVGEKLAPYVRAVHII